MYLPVGKLYKSKKTQVGTTLSLHRSFPFRTIKRINVRAEFHSVAPSEAYRVKKEWYVWRHDTVARGGVYSIPCMAVDAFFYDRGGTFPLKRFLNDGVPKPKVVGMSILFRKMTCFLNLGHGIIHRDVCLISAEVSFWVNLRKFRVNLYRRKPP